MARNKGFEEAQEQYRKEQEKEESKLAEMVKRFREVLQGRLIPVPVRVK